MAAAVGEPIRITGENFLPREDGWVDVTFKGRFIADEPGVAPEPVDLTIALATQPDGSLLWKHFGGYRVPFTAQGDRIGRFEGTVTATNRPFSNGEKIPQEGGGMDLQFTVKPSVVVRDFRAVGDTWIAGCKYPAAAAINGLPYLLQVRALGFTPTQFEFVISPGLVVDGVPKMEPTRLTRPTLETDHGLWMTFADVPELVDDYSMSISVTAVDAQGVRHETPFIFPVRRALTTYFTDDWQLAQTYPPTPVSGCTPGGQGGLTSTYSETVSERRERTGTISMTQSWERSYGTQHSETWGDSMSIHVTEERGKMITVSDTRTQGGDITTMDTRMTSNGKTVSNRVGSSRVSNDTWDHTMGDGRVKMGHWTGGGGVSVLGNGGDFRKGRQNSESRHETDVRGRMTTESTDRDRTTTNSREESEARSRSQGFHWSRSHTFAETNSFSHSESVENTRSYHEMKAQSENIGRTAAMTMSDTISISSETSTSLHTTGRIFPGQYGMWYRQTSRFVRVGTVVAYDLCGNGTVVGHSVINNYTWAPNLAIGDRCVPQPQPNLPPARCYHEPCDE